MYHVLNNMFLVSLRHGELEGRQTDGGAHIVQYSLRRPIKKPRYFIINMIWSLSFGSFFIGLGMFLRRVTASSIMAVNITYNDFPPTLENSACIPSQPFFKWLTYILHWQRVSNHIFILECCICLENTYLGSNWSSHILVKCLDDPENYDMYPPKCFLSSSGHT